MSSKTENKSLVYFQIGKIRRYLLIFEIFKQKYI